MIDFKSVVERIKQVRGTASQKEFAEKAGINAAYLSNIENYRTKPSIDFLTSVSLAYDVSLDWLMGGLEKSAHGAIIKSKGINVLRNYGSISQASSRDPSSTGGPLSELLDRLSLLSIENDKLSTAVEKIPSLEIDNNDLRERNKKLESIIMAQGITCD